MGVRQEITCVFHNSIEETIKIFKEEIMQISADSKNKNRNEIYSFAFCRYDDYKVITKKMYVLVYPYTIIFLWSPVALALFLNDTLQVDGGDSGELEVQDSLIGNFNNLPNIHYLGSIFNMKGELFEAFTINDDIPKENAISLFENRLLDTDGVSPSDDDIIHVSMEFLKYQIEKFKLQIETSVSSEDGPVPSIEENPFANDYYDHDILPVEDKRPLGERKSFGDPDV